MGRIARFPAVLAASLLLFMPACGGPRGARGTVIEWIAGHDAPAFDPDGPPDALRWAIERHLSRGLTDEDSAGRIVPAAAESITISPDRLTVRFRVRSGLAFTDGHPCTSEEFRTALRAGLGRTDHATRQALLGAIVGVAAVRSGRKLPALGIDAPDPRTLVLRLSRPDSLLLRKLSLPGVSTPWRRRGGGTWQEAVGLGPYRVHDFQPGRRLTLVRRAGGSRVDTLRVRFVPVAARVRALLRASRPDLVWPVPPSLLDQPLPAGFEVGRSAARPVRQLLLVMRSDVPPTTRLPARQALAHALNRGEVSAALAKIAEPPRALIPGAPPFEAPAFDAGEVSEWMARGNLGRSFQVAMAYDAEGAGAAAARALQGSWSRQNIYAELRPVRPELWAGEALSGQSQLVLVESQALLDQPASRLAEWVMPLRGPAAGAYRTGWRTREFDPWIEGRRGTPALDPAAVQDRVAEEVQILPLALLPWVRVTPVPAANPARFHPHYGADFVGSAWVESLPRRGFAYSDHR